MLEFVPDKSNIKADTLNACADILRFVEFAFIDTGKKSEMLPLVENGLCIILCGIAKLLEKEAMNN